MKIKSNCLYCLFFRAQKQIDRLTTDEELRFNALVGVMQIILDHVNPDVSENIPHPLRLCPSYIGTKRDRFLQNFFQVDDIYKQEKELSKAQASELRRTIQAKTEFLPDPEKKLQLALAIATAANIIEYDLSGQGDEFKLEKNLEIILNSAETDWDALSVEYLTLLISEIEEANTILYLTDNTGEAHFDAIVIDLLLQQNKQVIVAGKSKPILNDATVTDLKEIWHGLNPNLHPTIVSIGTNSVGLLLDEISKEFSEIIKKTDLIIAKGMGHFETLPEYDWDKSVWCLFRSKCEPVAKEANSIFGKNCIRKIS